MGENFAVLSEDNKVEEIQKRQSVNVFKLGRGSIGHLGMDPAEVNMLRQKSQGI